jgi:hypothetical protein
MKSREGATERGAPVPASTDHALEELVVRHRDPPTTRATFFAIIRPALGALE